MRGESRGACGLFVGFSDDRRFFVPVLVLFVFFFVVLVHRRNLAAASCYPCSIAAAVACPWIFSRSASSSPPATDLRASSSCLQLRPTTRARDQICDFLESKGYQLGQRVVSLYELPPKSVVVERKPGGTIIKVGADF